MVSIRMLFPRMQNFQWQCLLYARLLPLYPQEQTFLRHALDFRVRPEADLRHGLNNVLPNSPRVL